MNWLQKIRSRFRALFGKDKLDADMNDEMRAHVELRTQANIEAGMSPAEARFAALRLFGWTEKIQEDCREQRGLLWMENLFRDIRFGARQLRKSPGFAIVAVLTLTFGIGANTTIFSVINGVLLKPLPYRAPEQLISLFFSSRLTPEFPLSPGDSLDYRERNTTLNGLAFYTQGDLQMAQDDRPEHLPALRVSAGYFDLLGVQPLLGREFRREDELPDNNHVLILSHGLWQRRFHGDPMIVGKAVTMSGQPFVVVGVMPPGVQHVGGAYHPMPHGDSVAAWWPVALGPDATRGSHYLNGIGRLKPGVSLAQAKADLNLVATRLAKDFPDSDGGWGIAIKPLHEEIVGPVKTSLLGLFGAVVFVLLISCVNVANLLLARATSREREMALRVAVGAGSGRIIRQLLTESLLLALISCGSGTLLAYGAIAVLRVLGPQQIPRLQSVTLDGSTLIFTVGLTILTSVLFGLAPALQARKVDLNDVLKEGGRSGTSGRRRHLRDGLVITEITLALTLLVGAGLLMRSFWRLQHTDPGFNAQRVLTANLELPSGRYSEPGKAQAFQQQLLARLAGLPGVQSAALTSDVPWTGYDDNCGFEIEGKTFGPNDGAGGRYHFISADYFRTVGTPLLAGRFFNEGDRTNAPQVALINHTLAELYWPGENPLGRRITFRSNPQEKDWITVVGIVGDVKDFPTSPAATKAFYLPLSQRTHLETILTVRTASAPLTVLDAVRREIGALDKELPLSEIKPLDTIASAATAGRRFVLRMVGLFALIALFLAALGIYSVLSYLVAQRTREIGVRMALGAQFSQVLHLVIRQGMTLVISGCAVGLAASLALTRLIKGLLYEIDATDPLTFLLVAAIFTLVALFACWLPARRATRVDPMVALRQD